MKIVWIRTSTFTHIRHMVATKFIPQRRPWHAHEVPTIHIFVFSWHAHLARLIKIAFS